MNRFIVFDGNSILNRAFYGVRPLSTKDGFPTNALFGFVNILRKNLAEGFTHAAIAYDLPEKTFRHKHNETYKATRKGMPEDLAKQLPVSKEIAKAMGLAVLECPGYEADDILGTVSRLAEDENAECVLVTGDRDSFQLVSEKTTVWLAANNETRVMTPQAIREQYGVEPRRLIDVKSIMGDASDNIKGVPGIGEKGALALIAQYGTLDGVYEHIDEIKGANKTKLEAGKESAYDSLFLATIVRDAPISANAEDYLLRQRDDGALFELFTRLEFGSFINGMSVSKPSVAAEERESVNVTAQELCNLSAEKIYAETDGETLYVFDTEKLYSCPLDAQSARLFSCGKKAVFWSAKEVIRLFLKNGWEFKCPFDDISLMAYIVSPAENGLTPEKAVLNYLGINEYPSLCALLPELEKKLDPLLDEMNGRGLYEKTELPLAKMLAKTEYYGFGLDAEGLKKYGDGLEVKMRDVEQAIYSAVGHEFNINSPKQLGVVLFEEMNLPHYKKTQSGYSTSAEVLELLSPFHPVPDLVLLYRKTAKLKSTYCDGLLNAVSEDGRVHTTFRQTLTKTGRLSSIEPNLQNIPVRTPEGRELRKFFRAKEGYVLIDADYSQIELRVMAHVSGDETMIKAFRDGSDIHASTAAKVFGVPQSEVTPQMRKQAKAVNFGIIYGISDYALGQDTGMTKKQAGEYIKNYLNTYPKIRDYLENVKAQAKKDGYVTTMFGRRRYIPELRSSKKTMQAFGERVAMNTPIQGSAADIIKIAMINAEKALEDAKLDARIILQVHDELIVEARESDAEQAKKLLIEAMENAAPLCVPLTADAGTGKTWFDAKEE
ncbi:MAG: DNA polymerase I [Clostridia bacterium]|nr:DNA polymerase I [Clostridia bacterium]